jgi:hypothetical protein
MNGVPSVSGNVPPPATNSLQSAPNGPAQTFSGNPNFAAGGINNGFVAPPPSNTLQNAPNGGPATQQFNGNLNGIPGGVKGSLNVPMPASNGSQNQPNSGPNDRAPGAAASPTTNSVGGAINASAQDNPSRNDANNWRFSYYNGQWWYWMPGNYWMYYRGNNWNRFNDTGAQ